jgi:hypothetical protein
MRIDETHNISIIVPVSDFLSDVKEITELFNYVFDKSILNGEFHPKNTFSVGCELGMTTYRFVLSLRISGNEDEDRKMYEIRKSQLEMLIDDYARIESQYLQFRKFGNIESGFLIRRKH